MSEASWGYQSIKTSDEYRDGWDRIWGEKNPSESAFETVWKEFYPDTEFVQVEADD